MVIFPAGCLGRQAASSSQFGKRMANASRVAAGRLARSQARLDPAARNASLTSGASAPKARVRKGAAATAVHSPVTHSAAIDSLTDYQIEELRDAFSTFDVDGSGSITLDEIDQAASDKLRQDRERELEQEEHAILMLPGSILMLPGFDTYDSGVRGTSTR